MSTPETPDTGQVTAHSYIAGFVLSVGLTLAAYALVVQGSLTGNALLAAVVGLALMQLVVQLVFFLHLGRGTQARWNLLVFWFALIVVIILVFGSLWIMQNLNYHMGSPEEVDRHLMEEEGVQYR